MLDMIKGHCLPFSSANILASSQETSLRAPFLLSLPTKSILQPTKANTGLCGSICLFASIIQRGICSKLDLLHTSYTNKAPTEFL